MLFEKMLSIGIRYWYSKLNFNSGCVSSVFDMFSDASMDYDSKRVNGIEGGQNFKQNFSNLFSLSFMMFSWCLGFSISLLFVYL